MALPSKLPTFHRILHPVSNILSTGSAAFNAVPKHIEPLILGIETSCDDTGVAILNGNGQILSEVVKSQQAFSTRFGGVVPLFAASQHQANLPTAISEALNLAQLKLEDISTVAVTTRPGLVICLNEGVQVALDICKKYNKPMIPVHHMKAHALTCRMTDQVDFPYMCLLISGGHALITWVESIDKFYILGRNLDVAPGDVFDKVARRLKLAHIDSKYRFLSGGALIEKFAEKGDPFAIQFNMPRTKNVDCNFVFTGISTQALRKIEQIEEENSIAGSNLIPNFHDMCASVQHVMFKYLARKLMRAFEYIKFKDRSENQDDSEVNIEDIMTKDHNNSLYPRTLVVSGGVASNTYIRRGLEYLCSRYDCRLVCPAIQYCTDNGVMIAWNGLEKWRANLDVLHKVPMSFYVEPKCPIGEDISGEIKSRKLSRYVMNHTKSSFKLNVDFNKLLSYNNKPDVDQQIVDNAPLYEKAQQ